MRHALMINRLRKEMHRVGLNPKQLAERAKVGKSFVYDILNGKSSNPTTAKLAAIADILEVSVSYLVDGASNINEVVETSKGEYVAIQSVELIANDIGKKEVKLAPKGDSYFFRNSWITERLHSHSDALRVLFVEGDVMEPTLYDRDMIVIDTSKDIPNPSGVFVIFDGLGLSVRRLEFIPGSNPQQVKVISDNSKYTIFERKLSEVQIIGRVVWFSREI